MAENFNIMALSNKVPFSSVDKEVVPLSATPKIKAIV
jgi:hypothetical protein